MRVWVVLVLAGVFICWIGYNTQAARSDTERVSRETQAYALQTNDCLTQMLQAIIERTAYNKQLDSLVDQRSALIDRRNAAYNKLITEMERINDLEDRQARSRLRGLVFEEFQTENTQIDTENAKINQDRRDALRLRAEKQYPDPACGNKLPGE